MKFLNSFRRPLSKYVQFDQKFFNRTKKTQFATQDYANWIQVPK